MSRFSGLFSAPALALAGLMILPSGNASALTATFDTVGDTFDFTKTCTTSDTCGDAGSPPIDLILSGSITLDEIDGNDWTFLVSLTNLSDDPDNLFGDQVASFGFSTNPDALDVDIVNDAGDPFDGAALVNQLTGVLPNVEVCAFTGPNCQAGAGNSGLGTGETDAFLLALTFATGTTEVTISDFGVQFTGLPDSYQFNGGNGAVIPLPAALPLFLTALGGLGLMGWRRRTYATA